MNNNDITIDLEAIEKMEVGSISDSETIRQLSLQSIGSGDTSLLTRINPVFAFAGLYPYATAPNIFGKPNIEYERRFLLKKVPNVPYNRMIAIEQYYGLGSRFRSATTYEGPGSEDGRMASGTTYVKEIKNSLGFGMNSETPEVPMTRKQFKNAIKICDRVTVKNRNVFQINPNQIWEVDEFRDVRLVICEVEAKSEEEMKSITVPSWLSPYVIKEITGDKDFTNYKLAEKIK